jgi:hypothetical protein
MDQEETSAPLYFAMLLLAAKQAEIDAIKKEVSTYRNLAECWRDRFKHQSDQKLELIERNKALKEENDRLREELKEQKGYTVTWREKKNPAGAG